MSLRDDIVAEARSWIGTPFHHLGRQKGLAVDCVGVVVMVARAVGITVDDPEWYPHFPINNLFEEGVDARTDHVDMADLLPGDLLKLKYKGNQQHLTIVTSVSPTITVVHAAALAKKVVETNVEMARIAGARRLKELA